MLKKLENKNYYLVFIFLLALIIRLIFVFSSSYQFKGDEPEYIEATKGLMKGSGLHFGPFRSFWGPMFPFYLAIIFNFFGFSMTPVIISQVILSSSIIVLTVLIGLKIGGKFIGYLSGILACFYYGLIIRVNNIYPDTLFTFFLSFSILYLLKIRQRQIIRDKIISGLALGLATLTKPITLLLPCFILIWLITFLGMSFRTIKVFTIIILSFLMVVLPWTWRNYNIHHTLVPISTEGGITFWGSNNPQANGRWNPAGTNYNDPKFTALPEAKRQIAYFQEGFKYLKTLSFFSLGRLFCLKILGSLYPFLPEYDWTFVFLFPFFLGGMYIVFRYYDKTNFLYYPILTFLIATIIFCGYPRFREPIAPYIIIFASLAFEYLWKKYKQKIVLNGAIILWLIINLIIFFNSEYIRLGLKNILKY